MSKSLTQSRKGLTLGRFYFAPGLIPTIVTLLLFTLLINLGFWQIRRGDAKQAMVQRLEQRSKQPSRDLASLSSSELQTDLSDFPLQATGHYLNQYNLLLDNRTHQGEPGYQVLTAFLTNGKILLVNRGWVAQGPNRAVFPIIPADRDEITVHGKIEQPNPNYFVLKEDDYQQVSWPFLIQKIDLDKTEPLFDHPLLPFVLLLNPEPASFFIREWHSNFMGPEKHYGYALQWFSLAAALLVIYLIVNTERQQ